MTSARNITERRKVKEELRRSEERFRATFEQAAVGIAHNAFDGSWLRVNQRLCDILGYTCEELREKTFQYITHPADLEADLDQARRLIAGEISSYSMEKRYVKKDGSVMWGNLTVSLAGQPSVKDSYFIAVIEDIDQRKRAEEALRESNRRIENILESITEDFFAVDRDSRYTYINERALRRIQTVKGKGLMRRDFLGKSVWEVFPEQVGSDFYHKYHEALREQKTIHFEEYLPRTEEWYTCFAYPSEEGLAVYFRDITERKRTEEKLRQSEERLRAQYNSFPVPTFSWRKVHDDFELVDYNEAADKITQSNLADMMGMRASQWYADKSEILGMLQRCFEEGSTIHEEIPWRMRTTGEHKHFAVTFAYVSPDLVIHYAEDITERKRAEEALEESHTLLRSIIEGTPDAIFLKDIKGRYLMANSSAAKIVDQTAQELLGKDNTELMPPQLARRIVDVDRHVMETEEVQTGEEQLPVEGVTRTYLFTKAPYRDHRGEVAGIIGVARDITERKRIEEALRQSEERFRTVVEEQTELICRFLPDKTLTFVNGAYCRYFGMKPEDMIGCNFMQFVPSEDYAALEKQLSQLSWENPMRTVEHRVLKPNGQVGWQQWTNRAIFNEERRLLEYQAVGRDITERKQAEDHVRLLLESTYEGIYGVDSSGRCTFVNRSAAKMLGYGREELLGKNMHRLIHHSHEDGSPYPEEECPIMHAFQDGQGVRVEDEVLWRRDGNAFPAEYSSYPIVENGVLKGTVVTFVDSTERRRAQEDLHQTKERFHSLVQYSSDSITILAADGTIQYESPAVERVLGYQPEEVVGKKAFDYIHPDDLEQASAVFAQVLDNPEVRPTVEYRFWHANGSWRYLESISSNQLRNPSVQGVVVNSRDVTERKKLEENQQRFLTNAAHQLKTPITTIAGAAELLVTKQDLDAAKKRQLLDHIFSEGRHMQQLSDTLLRLARVGWDGREPDLEVVDLAAAGRQAAERMVPLAESTDLSLRLEGDSARVLADSEWLQEVLLILLSNGVKYSSPGREITLRLLESAIIVEDEGAGISSDDLPHVFERFYKGKGSVEGFGLGLSICRELVERMGGRITLSSAQGVGTMAKVELPKADVDA